MEKMRVSLGYARTWYPHMNSKFFFGSMPYMFRNFVFVEGARKTHMLCCSHNFPPGNFVKIFYTPENLRPPMNHCDWAFGFDYEERVKNPRYMRLPNYVRLGACKNLIKGKVNVEAIMKRKTKFCAFVFSHNVPLRNKFFDMLSKYKKIDAPGACRRNCKIIGPYSNPQQSRKSYKRYTEKLHFLSQYKFTIAFENSSFPGYTTEKIYHPMQVNSIPIYWGNPQIHRDFNPKSFVSAYDVRHPSIKRMLEYLVERVIAVDKNPDMYAKMLMQPWYPGNTLTPFARPMRFVKRFQQIFGSRRQ